MSSFLEKYCDTLNQLHRFLYHENLNDNDVESICSLLLKRTLLLAFYDSILTNNDFSGEKSKNISKDSDNFLVKTSTHPFSKIAEFFFPLNWNQINNFTEKRRINNIIDQFHKICLHHLTCSSFADRPKLNPEIFQSIYFFETTQRRGAVYTPSQVTYWMVKSCFQHHFAIHLGNNIFSPKGIYLLDKTKIDMLKNYILKIRVLDIAVGSGTFYLAAFDYLMAFYTQLGFDCEFAIKHILTTNLYGIDIDESALQVCKCRLAIDIINKNTSIDADELLWILKNTKLKIGNSVIGLTTEPISSKYSRKEEFNDLFFKQIKKSEVIDIDFIKKMKIFHWFLEFPEICRSSFNIIIGNPPYIGYRYINQKEKRILKTIYPKIYTGLNDYYYYFISRALQLLSPDGYCSLIVARYFLEARYAKKLRTDLIDQGYIDTIIDFRSFKIFPKGINTTIIFLTKFPSSNYAHNNRMIILKNLNLPLQTLLQELQEIWENPHQNNTPHFKQFKVSNLDLINGRYLSASKPLRKILEKIEKVSKPLSSVCDIGTGYHSGKDRVFSENIININGKIYGVKRNNGICERFPLERNLVKEILKTTNILPFVVEWNQKYVLLTRRGINIDNYPLTKYYLEQFKDVLMDRYEVKNHTAKWYEIAQIRNPHLFKAKIKVICPYRARTPRFAIDEEQRYTSIDCTSIIPKKSCTLSIYYILGVLNSELIESYLYMQAKKLDAQKIELYPKTIGGIPLIIPTSAKKLAIAKEIELITKNLCFWFRSFTFSPIQRQNLLNHGKKGILKFEIDNKGLNEQIKQLDMLVYRIYDVENQIHIIKKDVIHP